MMNRTGKQNPITAEELKERRSTLHTQGRKGAKAVRINMAFTPENHTFVKVYAASTGQTMTQACNQMIEYARKNPEFIQAARESLTRLLNDIDPQGEKED